MDWGDSWKIGRPTWFEGVAEEKTRVEKKARLLVKAEIAWSEFVVVDDVGKVEGVDA